MPEKPLILRSMRVQESQFATLPKERSLRASAHHVCEIFCLLLPPKFILDGSALIQITLGGSGLALSRYHKALGSSEYCIESFDLSAYASASNDARQNVILDLIESSLIDIAGGSACATKIIRETAGAVRASNFHACYSIPKLTKSIHNIQVSVFRELSLEKGELWLLKFFDKRTASHTETSLGKCPGTLDLRDFYMSSSIEGSEFVLRNRLGKVVHRHDLRILINEKGAA